MTSEQYQAWLADQNAIRCVLIEAVAYVPDAGSGHESHFYFSNRGYVTQPSDTPANQFYLPCISGDITFNESINLDASPNISFGDIHIDNSNGERDDYLKYVWAGRNIQVYYGDPRWHRNDFQVIFSGKIENISSRDSHTLTLKVRNKLQQLNTPIMDTTLGGDTENTDKLLPVCFGEVCNLSPLLVNPALHEYQIHHTAIERIIEVRDFGSPVPIVENLANGTFRLNNQPFGSITLSAQGDISGGYKNSIAEIIQYIVQNYGKQPFNSTDIDTASFTDFNTHHPQSVGYYADSRENILNIISYLADSLGAQVLMSREGQLRIMQIELPSNDTAVEITAADMQEKSLSLVQVMDVKAAIKLGFCRNYTQQQDLQTGILEEHKDLFANQWLSVNRTDNTIADLYLLDTEPEQKDTALMVKTDAENEAQRLLDIWKIPRKIYRFKGFSKLLDLQLGQSIQLNHEFNHLEQADTGILIGLNINWSKAEVDCEVLI